MTRTQWDDAFPVSADADRRCANAPASPTVAPADNGRERVPVSYVGGPLHGLVAGFGERVEYQATDGHYSFDDDCLVMRWKPTAE